MIIEDEIIQIIEDAKLAPIPARKNNNLYTDLGFDSLSFIHLLLKIEGVYSINFDILEMELCLQVDQLITLVENKVKESDKYND